MESLRHAFTKSRSPSSASSPPPPLKARSSRDSTTDPPAAGTITAPGPSADRSLKTGRSASTAVRDSMSSKRDSGIARSLLGSLGGATTNGRNHSRAPSGASSKSLGHSITSNGSLNVSDRLEAVLAQTAEMDAANVAHLAQAVSEMTGKAHGLHGAQTGILASDITRPGSSSSPHGPPHQDFVHFSPATLSRTRKVKASYEIRMTGMRIGQQGGRAWNPLQCLRDREVRRLSGETQPDLRLLETQDSSKYPGSLSSFGGSESIGEGRTKGSKRHSSPIQQARGHVRQQGSRRHADRFRTTQRGYEFWSVTPEEFLANIGWQQANPNRMVNHKGELIHPLSTEEERKSDSLGSKTSSLELDRKATTTTRRYSSDGGPVTPQLSHGSPLANTPSIKSPLRNVPSFAMSAVSLPPRSRSPSPVRGSGKHSRQTSDLLDVPTRVKRKIQDKIMGDKGSGISSRSHSPARSDYFPPTPVIDLSKAPRSIDFPVPLRLDMDFIQRRATIASPRKSIAPPQAEPVKRDLARTRARLASTGITARAMLAKDNQSTPFTKCYALMGTIDGLHRSINTSFEQQHPKAVAELNATLSTLESRQAQVGNQVQSALAKTRGQIGPEIADIAAEQTSTLLLQVKAVEDKMDALEYRTKSGWTHEKTLHVVFLVLEYIVMVVLWHLWLLLSVLRVTKKIVGAVWIVVWGVAMGIYHLIQWLFFMNPS